MQQLVSLHHILTASATTIHENGDGTDSNRFPDCSVIPGNPSTEQTGEFPWGFHELMREGAHDRCDELRSLTPHRGQFGFDVIEWVGRALFVEGRNERAVQAELAARNIPISTSEIGFLGKRFIVYLALAHRACQDALREHLCAKGGYILHLDATCEGDSPQLFSAMDELSRMVLGNRKMPSEDSQTLALHKILR